MPRPTATHLARLRTKADSYLLPDTCLIKTPVKVDDGEGGFTYGPPTTQGPYACRMGVIAVAGGRSQGEQLSEGQELESIGFTVILPALAPVDLDDTIVITVTETGETVELAVQGVTKSSDEILRTATCSTIKPHDLT